MKKKHSSRQNQIIKESIKIIHTKGIQGLTIKNIATAINVTEAAIYRHFKSKDEIISTILDDFKFDLDKNAENVIKNKQLTAYEKLNSILNYMAGVFCDNPYIVSVIFSDEIFKNKLALYDKIIDIIKQNSEYFFLIAKEGQKKGEMRSDISCEELSVIIMGSFRMIIKNWQISHHSYSLKKRGEDFLKSLFKIISTEFPK